MNRLLESTIENVRDGASSQLFECFCMACKTSACYSKLGGELPVTGQREQAADLLWRQAESDAASVQLR
jgi:hypothetical protein